MKPSVVLNPHLIRTRRKDLGLSQGDLADRLLRMRTSSRKASLVRTIQVWEKDGRVSNKWAIDLAKALKVELIDLMTPEVKVPIPPRADAASVIVGSEETEKLGFLIRTSTVKIRNNKKGHVALVIDPYSRFIVGSILHSRQHSEVTDQEVVASVRRAQGRPRFVT